MNRRAIALVALFLAASLASATAASASEPVDFFTLAGSDTQAGAHPDIDAIFALKDPGAPESAKSVSVNLPEGLFGNPRAITQCNSVDFALSQCPINSQAGTVTVSARYGGNPSALLGTAPIYDLEPRSAQETARFGFVAPTVGLAITIPVAVRSGSDYGLRLSVVGLSQLTPLAGAEIRVWGIPADDSHDFDRFAKGTPGHSAGCPGELDPGCASDFGATPHLSSLAPVPLVDNPTTCAAASLTATLSVRTYQDPDNESHATTTYPPTTGCESESFSPSLLGALTSAETDSPAGIDLQFRAVQFESQAISPSELRSVSLALPPELTINPDAADGQSACTEEQANFGSEGPAACPDNAKIGTFDIETPALSGPLTGSLYFGEPVSGDRYRVFMIASGFGINAKLIASVRPDPSTGQVTMGLADLPQVPFAAFDLHLFAAERGLLATPTHCGHHQAAALFTPWNATLAPQSARPDLSLSSGPDGSACPGQTRPFAPRLRAGTSNASAGSFSDFSLELERDDGDQFLGDLNFRLPPGFSADLRGVASCPQEAIAQAKSTPGRTEQAAPSCPESSLIGAANIAAGPGLHPFHALGKVYLAGPYQGAPLSLAVIVPALAGPFDYGTAVVRVALHVDPSTAQVSAISDTVPSIIGGVPIRLRSIAVNVDRSNFTLNPTNCSPLSVSSQGIGDQGAVADFSSYFQVVNCSALPFRPRMTMTLLGHATRRSSTPSLRIDLTTRPGDANIKSLAVTLSNAFQIAQDHLGNICTETQLAKTQCAGNAQLGTATTTTPLLDQPLSGPVYAVSGSGGLPRLAFILNGQVTIIPRADARNAKGNRLQTTVPVVPDAPIGHFVFDLFGGHQGYLATTRSLCAAPVISSVSYVAQNGRTYSQKLPLKAKCPKARKPQRHQKRHRKRHKRKQMRHHTSRRH